MPANKTMTTTATVHIDQTVAHSESDVGQKRRSMMRTEWKLSSLYPTSSRTPTSW